jgi:hypothetical protein
LHSTTAAAAAGVAADQPSRRFPALAIPDKRSKHMRIKTKVRGGPVLIDTGGGRGCG